MPKIHSTSIVSPSAVIAEDVEIGPFCVIDEHVKIGPGCRLGSHCVVTGHTTLGANNRLYTGAVLGSDGEDLKVDNTITTLEIGDNNTFREYVTVNRGTYVTGKTVIGNHCFMMAYTHVAHDCRIGNGVIFVDYSGVAGHVHVGDKCLISGLSGVHQFCRIGRFAVLSGGSTISMDLPPFMIGEGRNGAIKTINVVGLKRANFPKETIQALRDVCKIFFKGGLNVPNALAKIADEVPPLPEVQEFVDFVKSSKRGVLHGRDVGRRQ